MSGTMKFKNIGTPMGDVVSSAFASLSSELVSFDSDKYSVFPGFCDVHVHFREPGFW